MNRIGAILTKMVEKRSGFFQEYSLFEKKTLLAKHMPKQDSNVKLRMQKYKLLEIFLGKPIKFHRF